MTEPGKVCTKCKEWKLLTEFHRDRAKTDGLFCWCKICARAHRQRRRVEKLSGKWPGGVIRILSLGWGVQSFGLAAMSALGVLPKIEAAVHVDVGHEREETYAFVARWTPWLEERGVEVVTLEPYSDGNPEVMWDDTDERTMIPAYTINLDTGKHGRLNRYCTLRWKVVSSRQWLRQRMHALGAPLLPGSVELWFGITQDESRRRSISDRQYISNSYPYLDMFDHPWHRHEAITWLVESGLEVPIKSSCVFCPFRPSREWRKLQLANGGDWQKAVELDRAIRHKSPGHECFLSYKRQPLDECDFSSRDNCEPEDVVGASCSALCPGNWGMAGMSG